MRPALRLEGVQSGYGRTIVIRDLSLAVPAGSVTVLLGPNGAGKTTLLRTISGFVPAARGQIELHGANITGDKPHRRAAAGICHIPEGRGIFASLTVRENLVMQSNHGDAAVAMERATTAFPILGRRLGQLAGTLSGGEQQMLALSAAYLRDPKVILVDEASLGLAPIVVEEIFEFLIKRARAGNSLFIVDQFATRALSIADAAYVIAKGRITYEGSPTDLLSSDLFERYLSGDAQTVAGDDSTAT